MKCQNLKYNSYYLGLVQNLYAGAEGEVVSVLQQLYQSFLSSGYEEELSEVLERHSSQDTLHLKMLSEIILGLSGDPIFANSQNKFIGGRNIDYVKNSISILKTNIELKEKNIIDYKTTIAKIDDKNITDILEMILENKIRQKDELEYLIKKYTKNN